MDDDVAGTIIIANDELLILYIAGVYRLRWRFNILESTYQLDNDQSYANLGDALRAAAYVVDQFR